MRFGVGSARPASNGMHRVRAATCSCIARLLIGSSIRYATVKDSGSKTADLATAACLNSVRMLLGTWQHLPVRGSGWLGHPCSPTLPWACDLMLKGIARLW